MNLGSLVTIAGAAPKNLHHFVFNNHTYEVNGQQPLPGSGDIDFAGMARAAGYPTSRAYKNLDAFRNDLPAIMDTSGPQFLCLGIIPGARYPRDYDYIHSADARRSFEDALNEPDAYGRSA